MKIPNNWSVRIGSMVLVLLVLVAVAAPWLGTVDPTLFDAASRDLRPGEVGDITTLEGETAKHVFLMGSDSYGRDIYSRVIYGTRVSLVIGLTALFRLMSFHAASRTVSSLALTDRPSWKRSMSRRRASTLG